ncbi:hypothetical protein CCACVL1_19181 [Corchorus capsularis]|uniref:Uncharacterized protein n=1 Tax=Corchorus capsularis TaxID=210143 RepID=A0A1R3HHY3_COCAP|nr:hypothetical protein CCACVL1_19181 [Corchorus capsularis]
MGDSMEARMQWLEREWKTMQIDIFELKCKQETMAEEIEQLKKHVVKALIMSGDIDEVYKIIAKTKPSFRSNTSFRPPTHKAKSQPRFQTMSQPPSPEKEPVELTNLIPIPCTYTELFPALVQQGLIAFLPFSKPMKNPGSWYNTNSYCAYHSGTQGHSTENCLRLKEEVQRLIIEGELTFKADGSPVFSQASSSSSSRASGSVW